MIVFKKTYLVKRGFSVKNSRWARVYERIFVNIIAVYLVYVLVINY